MIFRDVYDVKNDFSDFFSSSKGTPFLKIPALPGNQEKSSYQVSVSLPGVGKIPVARKDRSKSVEIDPNRFLPISGPRICK